MESAAAKSRSRAVKTSRTLEATRREALRLREAGVDAAATRKPYSSSVTAKDTVATDSSFPILVTCSSYC